MEQAIALMLPIVFLFVGVNVLAFCLFGWDKHCAANSMRRVPEHELLLVALFGGAAGAIAGQQFFRHKTRKEPFRSQLYLMAGINIVAVVTAMNFDVPGMLFEAAAMISGKPT